MRFYSQVEFILFVVTYIVAGLVCGLYLSMLYQPADLSAAITGHDWLYGAIPLLSFVISAALIIFQESGYKHAGYLVIPCAIVSFYYLVLLNTQLASWSKLFASAFIAPPLAFVVYQLSDLDCAQLSQVGSCTRFSASVFSIADTAVYLLVLVALLIPFYVLFRLLLCDLMARYRRSTSPT